MKNFLRYVLLVLGVVVFSGCEDIFSAEDEEDITFVNKSSHTVTVIPQANSGWSGFKLNPGEARKLKEPSDVFFTYEPRFRVTVADSEDGRVLFINLNENTVEATSE